jgi:transcriptional regulator with XRE-family HTH domain
MSIGAARSYRAAADEGRLHARNDDTQSRSLASGGIDTRVIYDFPVSEPTIDREAWAAEVALLVQSEAGGNKAAFARLVGLKSVRTVDRWLARTVNVSAESVSQVARALNLSAVDLLGKVGYLQADESLRQLAADIERDRNAIAFVREQQDIPAYLRREIEAGLVKTIEEQEQALMVQAQRMVEFARRQIGRSG